MLKDEGVDMILHAGDISYVDGKTAQEKLAYSDSLSSCPNSVGYQPILNREQCNHIAEDMRNNGKFWWDTDESFVVLSESVNYPSIPRGCSVTNHQSIGWSARYNVHPIGAANKGWYPLCIVCEPELWLLQLQATVTLITLITLITH
jgi:hypothetical protein